MPRHDAPPAADIVVSCSTLPAPNAARLDLCAYAVISPVRNEEEHLPGTIASMAAQLIRPVTWVIVDDGSTDATGRLADEAARSSPWIQVLHRKDRGFRKSGGGVIEAFNDGLKLISRSDWRFLVKFDGDLSFSPDYFSKCIAKFQQDPRLGIGGGTISNRVDGVLTTEWTGDPPFHVRGATKIYRRECWDAIGGLHTAPGWDTYDELKANMLGWTTRTFADLPLEHHRPAGGADGTWANWVKNGLANYVVGYHPLFMAAKCARRSFRRPYFLGALGLWTGFMKGYFRRIPQAPDRDVIRYVRREQLNRLLGRKSLWQ